MSEDDAVSGFVDRVEEDLDPQAVLDALTNVIDPELGIDIVNLGLVYGVTTNGTDAKVDMTLTTSACPLTDMIEDQAAMATQDLVSSLEINWVWLPPWGPERITEEGRDQLRAIGFNL